MAVGRRATEQYTRSEAALHSRASTPSWYNNPAARRRVLATLRRAYNQYPIFFADISTTRVEVTGVEVIGAANGLASLFNTTITWFGYVLVAKQAAPRLQSLLVKLDAAQLRLTRWGKAAGLTGLRIEDEESLKSSESFELDEQQEEQAIRTFRAVAVLFEECQKLCHRERKGKSENDPSVRENEISPFGTVGPNWNPMHRYLHGKMRDITDGRGNKVSVAQRVKFAIYKKEHLEKFIKDINDHIDELYKIYAPPTEKQKELGMAELVELLEVVKELGLASDRDPVIHSAVQNILKQENNDTTYNIKGGTAMNVGTHQGGQYTMTVTTDK